MKIVQFEDGRYALRTYWFFCWHFKSLRTGYSWSNRQRVIDFCLTGDYEKVKKLYQQNTMKCIIIKNKQ